MEQATISPAVAHGETKPADRRVVYLLGAGASHGAARFAGSAESLVMPGLAERLVGRMREEYVANFASRYPSMGYLVNEVVDEKTDFEHLLTFLADTPSAPYQEFAERLRVVFSGVLRTVLEKVRRDVGDRRSELYAALVDMHQVEGSSESLMGFLTLNYDSLLEHAIESVLGGAVDYGVDVRGGAESDDPIPVLKLHGSFSWRHTWPLEIAADTEAGLWIPPGIRKAKAEYPFNAIWGKARELLDCDVLRVIGCNLGSNDWDLVSLLFSTMHGRIGHPFHIEVIGRPETAARIGKDFPYFEVRSLLEIEELGPALISELLGGDQRHWSVLDEDERKTAIDNAQSKITNPFEHWLRVKGELMVRDLPTIDTQHNLFSRFIGEPV